MDRCERKEIIIGPYNIKRTIFSRQKDLEIINNIKNYILNIGIFNKFVKYVNMILNEFYTGFLYEKDNNIIGFCVWRITDTIYMSKKGYKYIKKLHVLLYYSHPEYDILDNIIINDIEQFAKRYEFDQIILENIDYNDINKCNKHYDNEYIKHDETRYTFLDSMIKTIEYENHENLSRLLFDINDKNIINQIIKYCQNKYIGCVSEKYIEKSFNTFHNGYVYKTNNYINGGVIWQLKNVKENKVINVKKCVNKYLHVLLFCIFPYSYKFRKRTLQDIELYAKEIGAKYILLEPLNESLITFYEKNGYSLASNYPIRLMSKQIT